MLARFPFVFVNPMTTSSVQKRWIQRRSGRPGSVTGKSRPDPMCCSRVAYEPMGEKSRDFALHS